VTDGVRPLRVAYVLLREPTYSETFISSEINAVRAAGAEVAPFFARGRQRTRSAEAVHAFRTLAGHPARLPAQVGQLGASYGARALLASAYATALTPQVREFDPDVVHTHFVNLPTAVAVLVAKNLRVPSTAVAHAADFLLDANPAALDRRVSALSHLFVISAAAATQLGEKGADLSRVPHSIVRAAFDGAFVDRMQPRPAGVTRLITIARLMEKKGIDTVVDAVGRLVAGGFQVRYDVYGDGPERERLRQRVAATSGLESSVVLHGATPHAEVMSALAAADLAVLPCRRAADGDIDGIPVFLMEAASRGVPVVTTAISGIPELVESGGGWHVRPDDPAALAAAIRQAASEPEESWRRSVTLRDRIRSEFSPALQATRLLSTWRQLVADHTGATSQTRLGG